MQTLTTFNERSRNGHTSFPRARQNQVQLKFTPWLNIRFIRTCRDHVVSALFKHLTLSVRCGKLPPNSDRCPKTQDHAKTPPYAEHGKTKQASHIHTHPNAPKMQEDRTRSRTPIKVVLFSYGKNSNT
ncbi:hypothetical protein RP20_CCG026673 [Aedes albopictus]|nr:hypothetical protein RP20_CCG026673 [Aedes albopictus]